MATIVSSISELVKLVQENFPLPDQIESITVNEDKISLKINPGGLFPGFHAAISFQKFMDGKIFLLIETNKFLSLASKIFKRDVNEWISFDSPMIIIDANKLLSGMINGLQITRIKSTRSKLIIYTS